MAQPNSYLGDKMLQQQDAKQWVVKSLQFFALHVFSFYHTHRIWFSLFVRGFSEILVLPQNENIHIRLTSGPGLACKEIFIYQYKLTIRLHCKNTDVQQTRIRSLTEHWKCFTVQCWTQRGDSLVHIYVKKKLSENTVRKSLLRSYHNWLTSGVNHI